MRRTIWARNILIVTLGLIASIVAFAHKTEVTVFPFSEVASEKPIRLGHIAGPVVEGPSKFSEIEDVEVLPGRRSGDRYFLGRIEMVRALQDRVSSEDFAFKIPNQVIIESKQNFIHKNEISRKILEAASIHCVDCTILIKDLKVPEPKGQNEPLLSWNLDFTNVKFQGSIMVPLKLEFRSGPQTLWVTGMMDLSKEALVARRQISPGERISDNDFEKKMVTITYLKGSLLSENEIKGQQMARFLAVGQPFVSGDIRKEAAATRGQLMKVTVEEQGMEISIQAIAEETGFVGDFIKLKNTETQKMISGRIIEKGVVKLQ